MWWTSIKGIHNTLLTNDRWDDDTFSGEMWRNLNGELSDQVVSMIFVLPSQLDSNGRHGYWMAQTGEKRKLLEQMQASQEQTAAKLHGWSAWIAQNSEAKLIRCSPCKYFILADLVGFTDISFSWVWFCQGPGALVFWGAPPLEPKTCKMCAVTGHLHSPLLHGHSPNHQNPWEKKCESPRRVTNHCRCLSVYVSPSHLVALLPIRKSRVQAPPGKGQVSSLAPRLTAGIRLGCAGVYLWSGKCCSLVWTSDIFYHSR